MAAPKGNKYNERWTIEASEEVFNKALELARGGAVTLTDIAIELDLYPNVFDYICEKHKVFISKKNILLRYIENNTYKGALNGEYVPSVAIFGLKNNHGWKDKTEVEQTVHQTNVIRLGKGQKPE